MAWLKAVIEIFSFLRELWNRFKPVKSQEQDKIEHANTDESINAKENPNARPKWD